jgi:hypothetical protein
MYDLLRKLNTLVSAQVNDLTSRLPNLERKPDLDRQVSELRTRVTEALSHEDALRRQVEAVGDEISGLNAKIDEAIIAGREAEARQLLDHLGLLEKRLGFAAADLQAHQRAAADLILRVNELEAAVGDLSASAPTPTSTTAAAQPRPQRPAAQSGGGVGIGDLMNAALGQPAQEPETMTETPEPVEQKPTENTAPASEAQPESATDAAAPEAESLAAADTTATPEPASATDPVEKPARPPYSPANPPRTATELAEMRREEAENKLETTTQGMQSVGGLLRDLQARTNARMVELDKQLTEGGVIDPFESAQSPTQPATGDKPTPRKDDLDERLSRLSKPDSDKKN